MDLEVARADRRLHPVPVPSRLGEGARHRRLAGPEEAQDAPAGRPRQGEEPADGLGLESHRPQPGQLGRRPGQDDDDGTDFVQHHSRSGAGEPERDRPLGERGLLGHACREVGVGTPQALGHPPRDGLDLALEIEIDLQRQAGRLRQQLDSTVVVGRAEPAGDQAEVGLEPLAQRRLQLLRAIADDRDAGRLEAEREHLLGQERPVQVGALAADELAPGDDDRGARPLRHGATCPGPRAGSAWR